MLKIVLLVACLVYTSYAVQQQLGDCADGSSGGQITSLEITNCNESPCVLVNDTTYTATLKFTSNVASQSLTLQITTNILGLEAPYQEARSVNMCEHGVKCPVEVGEESEYEYTFNMDGVIPRYNAEEEWAVIYDDGSQACGAMRSVGIPANFLDGLEIAVENEK